MAQTVLQYIHTLEWPVVALAAMLRFGEPVQRLFKDRKVKRLSGLGASVDFEEDAREQAAGSEPIAPAPEEIDLLSEWGREMIANTPDAPVLGIETWQGTVSALVAMLEIFEFQLQYLRLLAESNDGLTIAATTEWLSSNEKTKDYAIDTLTTWLSTKGFVELWANGVYRITPRGRAFVDLSQNLWYAQKAY